MPLPAKARERIRFAAVVVGAGIALWFAIQGGEYSSVDLLRQQQQRRRLVREIDSLTQLVDSLRRYKTLVLTDPATQERIAREEFGMVRAKELLYRFAEPASQTPPRSR